LAKIVDHTGSQKTIMVALAAWLIPGAGHVVIGDRGRGLTIFIAITITFLIGIMIGGVHCTVNFQTNKAWFFGQIFAGGYTIASAIVGSVASAKPSYGKTLDLATIYTGVAGLLNVLVILDAMARSARKAGRGGITK